MAISGSDDRLTKNRMQLETLPPTLSPHLGYSMVFAVHSRAYNLMIWSNKTINHNK